MPKNILVHVGCVLLLSHKAGVTSNVKKWNFLPEKINHLGLFIQPGKLGLPDHSTDAIREIKLPRNLTKLKSFL